MPHQIDQLVRTAVFGSGQEQETARRQIHEMAREQGAVSASIQSLYEAIGRREITQKFTVPAHNIRTLTYDLSRALFRAAMRNNVGAFVFEIARSEIGYTEQRPGEYAACVLAAAVREGFRGPVFLQGDHYQASAKRWAKPEERAKEIAALEALMEESIAAEFYNIDIDTSTLVDLSFPTVDEQQRANYEAAAAFTKFIRKRQPPGIEISVGGEIGEVGKDNTTPEEFRAYMTGYQRSLGSGIKGISKVSIQTGSSHGGLILPDGTVAKAKIDFETISKISRIAREEYRIAGAVQHGASTLPEEVFDEFPKADTVEIHLATGFQNMVYDHQQFPKELRKEIEDWVRTNAADERKPNETDEQFLYKARKKALGPFKQIIWDLPEKDKDAIVGDLETKFAFLMEKLGVFGTRDLVNRHIKIDASAQRPERKSEVLQPISALIVEGEGE
jgi:fructose/tagatose bisphosphate aldolase